jgi:glutamine synthetase
MILRPDWRNPKDVNKETTSIIRDTMKNHGRIIFNGNNYSEEWEKEAKKRGLLNISSTVDAPKGYFGGRKRLVYLRSIKFFQRRKIAARMKFTLVSIQAGLY